MPLKRVKVITRNPDHYMRDTNSDIFRVQRNFDPDLHPLQSAREYKRALNAVKLERVFAKPLLGSLTHSESVSALCSHPQQLSSIYSGTVEGELYLWDLPTKKCKWKTQAHNGEIYCISSTPSGDFFFSVGNDKTIKKWTVQKALEEQSSLPVDTWLSDTIVTGLSHHYKNNEFITCGEKVLLWDGNAKAPKANFDWTTTGNKNEATVVCVKFNSVEHNIFAGSDYANNIVIYDTRGKEVKKLKMKLRVNALEWNPMEAMIFTAASEDYNAYSFDLRRMDDSNRIVAIHGGHTSAVIDLSYSPTGKEFCTASYDKSIRIFKTDENRSRDVYHGKRMFRVKSVLWSGDDKYIVSGSIDHNARLWKARASEKLGILKDREKSALNYSDELKRKYGAFPEIKRIARHRHLPKSIYWAKKEHRIIKDSTKRKENNVRKHSKPGAVPYTKAIEAPVVGLQDEYDVPSTSQEISDE